MLLTEPQIEAYQQILSDLIKMNRLNQRINEVMTVHQLPLRTICIPQLAQLAEALENMRCDHNVAHEHLQAKLCIRNERAAA